MFLGYESRAGDALYLEAVAAAIRHSCYVKREGQWVSRSAGEIEVAHRRAKYKLMVDDIETGKILEATSYDPVRRHPTLWELRQTWESNTPLRIYFAQPECTTATLLALEAHVKPVDQQGSKIREDQEDRMDRAARRWQDYQGWHCD